jgi:copper chaperone CopZ
VDLDTKLVRVRGSAIDPAAVLAAIDEAGYEAVAA